MVLVLFWHHVIERLRLTPLKDWVAQYKANGAESFQSSYTNYDFNFKIDVLNYINDFRVTPNEAAAIFNISSPSTVHKWVKLFNTVGSDALRSKQKGRPSMKKDPMKPTKQAQTEGSVEDLKTRIKRLEMENAYLKKLNALVQNKEKSPNKIKHK
ncbi:transposase [Desulfuribacillus stibiiarsenatis]|uniref:Transposase n=1 Tax=Desulfuribacillus stibiiarsenatis TaxID=1390249 RepID=A0A1E5L8R0_9FIRM|nr:transposase [Desulfuribacillus stibiiarsenatis]